MLRAIVLALILPLAAGLAMAQQSSDPVMGSSATSDQPPADAQEQVTSILAIGDAVGGGLGAGLTRMGEPDGRYDVTIRHNEESGLARTEVYDWATTLTAILSSNDYDVIVVLIGTNDRQTIRDGDQRYNFGTPEWTKAYTARIDSLLAVLKTSGARVFWVSIPPMKDADYDAAMRQITELQKQRVEANGMNFVDIRSAFLKPDGSFADYGPDNTSEYVRLRARDGVGFYKAGNNRFGQLVLQAIENTKAPAAPTPPVAAAETEVPPQLSAATPAEPKRDEVPVFGQVTFGGEIALIRPEDVKVGAAVILSKAAEEWPPAKIVATLRTLAKPGSAAEKFFAGAAPAPAPRGRADDFAAPPHLK